MRTSTPARSSEGARLVPVGSSGFTLLELSVVLLILGIALSFLAPRLRDPEGMALASSTARLATAARYLYDEAAYRRVPMRLNLDLDHQTYFVTELGSDPDKIEFVPTRSPLARPVALPDSVAFRDVVLPAVGVVTEGTVFAQFSPEGWADPLVVHLRSRSGRETTMAIEPLTGRTRIADAYVTVDHEHDDERDRDRSRDRDRGMGRGLSHGSN
jgi:prepilin-type N-terminal cleavage/methylation domain-containing protein